MPESVPPSSPRGKPTRPEDDISDKDVATEHVSPKDALAPPHLSLTKDDDLEAEDFVTPMVPSFSPKDIKIEVTGSGNGNGNGNGNGSSPKGWSSGTPCRGPPGLEYHPGGKKSLEGIAMRAFCLGNALSLCLALLVAILTLTSSPLWRLPFFVGALALFHFLEFWTTARRNTAEAGVKAFLLTANWPHYAIAHSTAMLECLIVNLFWPRRSWAPLYAGPVLLLLGLILTCMGQFIRTAAMLQAGSSFNHIVQTRLGDGHELVTTGIYSVIRHPAYFAFFWWGARDPVGPRQPHLLRRLRRRALAVLQYPHTGRGDVPGEQVQGGLPGIQETRPYREYRLLDRRSWRVWPLEKGGAVTFLSIDYSGHLRFAVLGLATRSNESKIFNGLHGAPSFFLTFGD
ncbi:protein-S-isoprenylcysteine O-methyltransferase [Apiospora arundinis]